MWSNHRSVVLSQLSVLAFSILLLMVAISAPWLVRWLVGFSRADLRGVESYLYTTIYTGIAPATVLLYSLHKLLKHISGGMVFIAENVELLRHISWSCFAGAAVCLISTLYYIPWLLLGIAAAFMGLIVRVVKNVVAQAVALQDEVDQTV